MKKSEIDGLISLDTIDKLATEYLRLDAREIKAEGKEKRFIKRQKNAIITLMARYERER